MAACPQVFFLHEGQSMSTENVISTSLLIFLLWALAVFVKIKIDATSKSEIDLIIFFMVVYCL